MTMRVLPLCGRALAIWSCLLVSLSGLAQTPLLLRETFSREFSVHVGGEQTPLVKEFISREVSCFVGAEPSPPYSQAFSRELSLLITTPVIPARVTQLSVSVSPTGDRVLLDWSAYNEILQGDVVRYRIYVSTTPFTIVSNLTPYAIVSAGTFTLTITNLTPWQDHYFAVVAEDALGGYDLVVNYSAAYVLAPQAISREISLFVGGEPAPPYAQAFSRELSLLITTPAPPDRLTQLAVDVSPTGDRATLDWSGYNELLQRDVIRYDIYIATHPLPTVAGLTPFGSVPAGAFSLLVSNLTAWQDHYFAVVAVDASGGFDPVVNYSAAYVLAPQAITREVSLFVGGEPANPYAQAISREVAILVPDSAVPEPVTGLNSGFTANTSVSAFNAIDLDWSSYNEVAQHDVARYRIYAGLLFYTDVSAMTPLESVPAGTFRHTVTGLHGNSIYYMAVVAEDALGHSNSTVYARSAQASIGALGEVLNLAVASFTNALLFTWTAPAQVEGFLAHYNLYFNGATNPVVLAKTATNYTATGLQPTTGYSFRLSTVDAFGTESAGVSLTAATLLDNPNDVAAQTFDGMVRLTWSHVEPNDLVKHYAVYAASTNFTSVANLTPVLTTRGTRADVTGLANGTSYFFAVTTVNVVDGEKPGVQTVSATPNPVAGQFADLAITNVISPVSAFSGQTITINWSVTNIGPGPTSTRGGSSVSSWSDRVLLSPDNVYGDADDVLLTNVTHTGGLSAGGGYASGTTVQLPTNLLGNYFVFVMANAAGQVYEHLDQGTNLAASAQPVTIGPPVPPFITQQPLDQTGFQGYPVSFNVVASGSPPLTYQWRHGGDVLPVATNATLALPNVQPSDAGSYSVQVANFAGVTNSRAAILTVNPPPPDLFVLGIQAPTNLLAGQLLPISWVVTNGGISSAAPPWQETLALAANPAGTNATVLFTLTNGVSLRASNAVAHSQSVIVPAGLSGNYWLVVRVDSANQVAEGYGETNNVATMPVTIVSPDLQPSLLTSAPTAVFGQPFGVTWTVTNTGTGPAQGNWSDRIWLSSARDSLAGATSLAVAANVSSLQSSGSYSNGATLTVPLNAQSQPGGYWLLVQVDANGSVAESNEGNNLRSAPLTLTMPPLPDLAVDAVISPTNALPGQTIQITWALTNRGGVAAMGLWSDSVVWSNAAAGVRELARFDFTNGLAAGGLAWRTQAVTLPINTPAGDVWLGVQADALAEIAEENEGNNLALATNATTVPLLLTLQLPLTQIAEDAANPIFSCTVVRNGDLATALTVSLASTDTNEVTVPSSLVILAGQSSGAFQARVLRDYHVDGPKIVIIGASAIGYSGASQFLTVLDADLPRLTLTFTTNAVWEGSTAIATVTRDLVSTNPVTVLLQSSGPSQLSPPVFITIPGGAAATNFSVLAVDDNQVEGIIEYTLRASATGFEGASANVFILDNDLPGVSVTLASATVSEGAGTQATMATVTRSLLSARSLSVDLESTNTAAALIPARVVIPANQYSVSFPVAAVNDGQVSGPKTTLIRPWVLASSTTTRLQEGASALLTVTDDDGPTLKVVAAKKLIAEGLNPATTLTVSRNTPATNALAVTLVSSDTTEATVLPDATIPAGTNAVTVTLTSLADGTNDGSRNVIITASALGFVSGTETIIVSDIDLPDLVVPNITAPAKAETDTYVGVGYRVVNQGLSPAGTNFLVRVYLSKDPFGNDKTLAAQAPFDGTIPVGLFFEQSLQVRLPQAAGDYWVVVEVDAGQQIAEVLEDNNTTISAAPITVRAAYGAWVQTSLTTALADTPVTMTGRATNSSGAGAPFKLVNLHILVRGTERVISALTDSLGNFATTWQPLPGEAGFYELFATHPGVSSAPVQDQFRLFGMRADPASAAFTVVETATRVGAVVIENLSDLPLTGLTASVVSVPAGLTVTASLAGGTTLAGDGQTALNYTVSPASPQAYGTTVLRVTSTEGASVDVTLVVSVEPLRPRLVVTPSTLVAGMARGRQAVVEFKLANEGGVPTGPITVALPAAPWLSLATTNPIPPLAPGETNATTITLLLTPAADLTLGAYEGSLALNCSNASLTVPFNFRALSEAKGDLLVTAVDELTYYAVGSPNLAGASVTVRDAVARTNVATGVTGTNGQFFVGQLPEGYYELELTAGRHTTYRQTHLVLAGQPNDVTAFLSREVVTYTWTVEPIEIEDRYKITIETTFETVVPVPVVTVDPPVIDLAEITATETQVLISITNHGLIAANNLRLSFPTHPLWEFTPLISQIGTLPARGSLQIPLIIRKLTPPGLLRPGSKGANSGVCHLAARAFWTLLCGGSDKSYSTSIAMPNADRGCGGGFVIGGGSHGGGGWFGGGGASSTWPSFTFPSPCACKLLAGQCAELPKVGLDLDWALKSVADWIKKAVKRLPVGIYVDDPSLKVSLEGKICTCCANGSLSYEGTGKTDAEVGVKVVFGGKVELPKKWSQPFGLKILSVSGSIAFEGLSDEGTISGSATYEKKCGADSRICGSVEGGVTISHNFNASGTVELEIEGMPVQGSLSGYIGMSGRLFGRLGYCDGKYTAGACEKMKMGWSLTVTFKHPITGATQTIPLVPENPGLNDGIYCIGDPPPALERLYPSIGNSSRVVKDASIPPELLYPANAVLQQLGIPATPPDGVCAVVKLRTEQEACLARDAFRATLEINNQDTARLENVNLALTVTDASGADRTSLFGVRSPELVGLSGVDGTGILAGISLGTAKWVIIPSSDAAPTNATQYYVAGRLGYVQNGAELSVPLAPVAITVLPTPKLHVHYFHERDVFSDDPFTDEIEPSIPFNLAVMVQNRGFGIAKNFRITSAQPQIVENEKGLLIEFQIIATEVAGRNMVPSLTAEFGNIGPGQSGIGRWLMTSTLQGLFIDYSATFQHLDALDSVKLSLLEKVDIHEMIHLVQAGGAFEDGKPDFLVNDLPDLHDRPDTLYLSDGRTNPVAVVESAAHDGPPTPGRLQIQLSAAMPGGWVYLRVPAPSDGDYRLVGVRRSDGAEITLDKNFWVTDRTFIGLGRRPIRENILHLFDYNSTGVYTLTYELGPAGDTTRPVSQVTALPANSYRRIPLNWSGADETGGSGLAGYDIFVSENGGPFTRWLARTPLTGSVYFGTIGNSYSFYSVAIDQAGNHEAVPGTPDAATTVTLTNRAPVLTAVTNQTIDEGTEFVRLLSATDPDPADALVFSLDTAPAGMTISPATGLIRWATGEATGPSTNQIVARVQDNGDPPLAATSAFTLVVREVNSPPTLAPIPDQTIDEGDLLTITNVASDNDLPANTLTFSLGGSLPAGATVDTTNGIFTWQPTSTQGPTTNLFRVIVTDNGVPPLGATQQFTVIVRDTLSDLTLNLGSTNLFTGESNSVSLWLATSLDVTSLTFQITAPTNRLLNLSLQPSAAEVISATLFELGSNNYSATLALNPALQFDNTRELARLSFLAVTNEHSAIVPLALSRLVAQRGGGTLIANTKTGGGRVFIVATEPLLDISSGPLLTLYGHPGANYGLQLRTNLAGIGTWTDFQSLKLGGRWTQLNGLPTPSRAVFYRAYESGPFDLAVRNLGAGIFALTLRGQTGDNYLLQTSPSLLPPVVWSDWLDLTLTNSPDTFFWTNPGQPRLFFRVRKP